MSFSESKIVKQITIMPESNSINLQWENRVLKDGDVISATYERTSYEVPALDGYTFNGITIDVNAFLNAFNTASLAEKDAAIAALTAAQAQVAALQAQIDAYTPPAPVAPVADPEGPTVDDLQIRLALNAAGLREAVELAVAGSDQSTKDWWDRANNFKRLNPMVIALGAALGKTDEELDGLWALAATLG